MSALEQIRTAFKAQENKEITCSLIDTPLYAKPLTAEDYLEANAINEEKDSSKKTLKAAKLITQKVIETDGKPAFRTPKGNSAQILATECPPEVFWNLFSQIFDKTLQDEIAETEKK